MSRSRVGQAWCVLLGGLALFTLTPVFAVQPDEMLADPGLESRARDISKGLRCVVCQNESIDESNADLARDLRLLVRDRLIKGDSDDQVVDFIVQRYGDYVLLKPPFKVRTYALWFAPLVFFLLAVLGAWTVYRRPSPADDRHGATTRQTPAPLSAAERERLARLMHNEDGSP